MRRSSLCSISANISAPCSKCGKKQDPKYPWPVHILYADFADRPDSKTEFLCADCCPEHGRPPLVAA